MDEIYHGLCYDGDAPSAAALRLEQLNRLEELKQDLERATARADGASRGHEHLKAELEDLTAAVADAREKRRAADHALAEANRALSRAEADRNIALSGLGSTFSKTYYVSSAKHSISGGGYRTSFSVEETRI